jgi:hypothetical protein
MDSPHDELETAVRKFYVESSKGGLMTDFLVLIAGVSSDDDDTIFYSFTESNSPLHSLHGLAYMGTRYIDDLEDENKE